MRAASLLLLALLSGCVAPANAPSLLPRAIERGGTVSAARQLVPVKPIDIALAARITELLSQARTGDAAFTKTDNATASALQVGRSAATGSEAWIAAQQARSALEAARQQGSDALAALDALLVAQIEAGARDTTLGGVDELRAAASEAEALLKRQTARLDQL